MQFYHDINSTRTQASFAPEESSCSQPNFEVVLPRTKASWELLQIAVNDARKWKEEDAGIEQKSQILYQEYASCDRLVQATCGVVQRVMSFYTMCSGSTEDIAQRAKERIESIRITDIAHIRIPLDLDCILEQLLQGKIKNIYTQLMYSCPLERQDAELLKQLLLQLQKYLNPSDFSFRENIKYLLYVEIVNLYQKHGAYPISMREWLVIDMHLLKIFNILQLPTVLSFEQLTSNLYTYMQEVTVQLLRVRLQAQQIQSSLNSRKEETIRNFLIHCAHFPQSPQQSPSIMCLEETPPDVKIVSAANPEESLQALIAKKQARPSEFLVCSSPLSTDEEMLLIRCLHNIQKISFQHPQWNPIFPILFWDILRLLRQQESQHSSSNPLMSDHKLLFLRAEAQYLAKNTRWDSTLKEVRGKPLSKLWYRLLFQGHISPLSKNHLTEEKIRIAKQFLRKKQQSLTNHLHLLLMICFPNEKFSDKELNQQENIIKKVKEALHESFDESAPCVRKKECLQEILWVMKKLDHTRRLKEKMIDLGRPSTA